ncbi:MAG: hypothetical protein M3Z33_01635 [Actinomycetota bacterium]|nr:hypothetical protein [Actinomycetota bacterium]
MTETTRKTCAYPGCEIVMEPAPERGPEPRYCDSPDHNAHSVFRALQRGEGDASPETAARLGIKPFESGGMGG